MPSYKEEVIMFMSFLTKQEVRVMIQEMELYLAGLDSQPGL